MSIQHLRRLALTLAVGLAALLAGAPLAVAQVPPPDPGAPAKSHPVGTPPPTVPHGTPLWVFLMVATAAAAFTGAGASLYSTRVQRRHTQRTAAA